HAAEHDDGEDDGGLNEAEGLRADEALPRGEEGAGKPAEHGAGGKGGELGDGGVDAERAAGDLVLAHRLPGAADGKPAKPQGEQAREQGKPEDHVIEEDDGVERIVTQPEKACEGLASS